MTYELKLHKPFLKNDVSSGCKIYSVVSLISILVNNTLYPVITPLASKGSGGNHVILIEKILTLTIVILTGGPEGAIITITCMYVLSSY